MEEAYIPVETRERGEIRKPLRRHRTRGLSLVLVDFVKDLKVKIVDPGVALAEEHDADYDPANVFGNGGRDVVCFPFRRSHGTITHILEEGHGVVGAVQAQPHLRARRGTFHANRGTEADAPEVVPGRGERLHQVAEGV